jgi:predicted nucleotidyltransferase
MSEPPHPERNNIIQFPSPKTEHDQIFDEYADLERLEREYYKLFVNPDPPTQRDIEEENNRMLQRQRQFRQAAEYVAAAFSCLPEVRKVLLFGSVAMPLHKEVPRFRQFRKYRVEIYRECSDVDLAVWLMNLDNLKELQRVRGRALNRLNAEHDMGVAHHQVDVHIMDPETDRYLGRLCDFGVCPKGKRECLVPRCGSSPFLQQIPGRRLKRHVLTPERSAVLFERQS